MIYSDSLPYVTDKESFFIYCFRRVPVKHGPEREQHQPHPQEQGCRPRSPGTRPGRQLRPLPHPVWPGSLLDRTWRAWSRSRSRALAQLTPARPALHGPAAWLPVATGRGGRARGFRPPRGHGRFGRVGRDGPPWWKLRGHGNGRFASTVDGRGCCRRRDAASPARADGFRLRSWISPRRHGRRRSPDGQPGDESGVQPCSQIRDYDPRFRFTQQGQP
jgi:hypothetical protein